MLGGAANLKMPHDAPNSQVRYEYIDTRLAVSSCHYCPHHNKHIVCLCVL